MAKTVIEKSIDRVNQKNKIFEEQPKERLSKFLEVNLLRYNRPSLWPEYLRTTENLQQWEKINAESTQSFCLALIDKHCLKDRENYTLEYFIQQFKEGKFKITIPLN